MRTISTPATRRTVIDATTSPRASFSFTGLRTMSRALTVMPAFLLDRHDIGSPLRQPPAFRSFALGLGGVEPLRDVVPIDDAEKVVHVLGAAVLVLQVVRV